VIIFTNFESTISGGPGRRPPIGGLGLLLMRARGRLVRDGPAVSKVGANAASDLAGTIRWMVRRLFTLLFALSLLLLVASAGVWACGDLPKDGWPLARATGFGWFGAGSFGGRIVLFRTANPFDYTLLFIIPNKYLAETGGVWRSAGFNFHAGSLGGTERHVVVIVPLWSLCAAFFLSAGFCERLATRRPADQKVCSSCGYDLRATPERCPECGTPADEKVKGR
jgi:hypothetical protein